MSEQNVLEMSQAELLELSAELEEQYLEFKNRGVKLDMSRGRPSAAQLDTVIQNKQIGDTLSLTVKRNGKEMR